MALRLGRLVGLACFALVLARLGRVLHAGATAPDWRLVGLAAMLVGGLLTMAALAYHLSPVKIGLLHLIGLILMVVRITAAPTLSFGLLPGTDTLAAVGSELYYAGEILQFGAPPVLAVPGLVALVGIGLWLLGSAWAWGAASDQVWLGILPPLGFYLYLSVMDRAPSGLSWHVALGVLATLGLLATSQVSRTGSGRVRDSSNRPLPRRRVGASAAVIGLVVAVSLLGVAALGDNIPSTGTMSWRNPGGGGDFGGGVSFNRFVGLRQSLLSNSDTPVFVAKVEGASERPTRQMYWKLVTLDVYDGTFWRPGESDFQPITDSTEWEDPALAYRGGTTPVRQTIRIEGLRDDQLPALYAPVGLSSADEVVTSGAEVNGDGSLRVNALTFQGLGYQVDSLVPTLDVASLASEGGELTPLFEAAAAQGQFRATPSPEATTTRPSILTDYLALPETLDPAIAALARQVTSEASSAFEEALLLEDFFLEDFDYDTGVDTGHSALDLTAWLNEPSSPNYRRGYCEQFATAMAVMGRTLGMPTRVVMGFTHGQYVAEQDLTVVRQRNAHAWVEVWFDSEGWVRFDPTPRGDGTTSPTAEAIGFDPGNIDVADGGSTAGVDPTDQPGLEDLPNIPIEDLAPAQNPGGGGAGGWGRLALVAAVIAAGLPPAVKTARRRGRIRRAREGDITAVWDEIVDRLSDLGDGPPAHQTPIEFASSTDPQLVPLARAYSATLYGGRAVAGTMGHLRTAEQWLESTYDRRRRTRATFRLRSLKGRLPRSRVTRPRSPTAPTLHPGASSGD